MYYELTGILAMVHPTITGDHHLRKGRIALITSKSIENGMVMLNFGPEEQFFYPISSLLILRNPDSIFKKIMQNATKMKAADFKLLIRMNMLLESGSMKDKRKVMEQAIHNEVVCTYCLQNLSTLLSINQTATLLATVA